MERSAFARDGDRRRRGRRHVDGILGLELDGGKDLLEPRPVVGSDGGWIVVGLAERDPVAAASGCDDRDVATVGPDQSGGAVHGDRLGCRAFRHPAICSTIHSSGVESPIGCEAVIRNRWSVRVGWYRQSS